MLKAMKEWIKHHWKLGLSLAFIALCVGGIAATSIALTSVVSASLLIGTALLSAFAAFMLNLMYEVTRDIASRLKTKYGKENWHHWKIYVATLGVILLGSLLIGLGAGLLVAFNPTVGFAVLIGAAVAASFVGLNTATIFAATVPVIAGIVGGSVAAICLLAVGLYTAVYQFARWIDRKYNSDDPCFKTEPTVKPIRFERVSSASAPSSQPQANNSFWSACCRGRSQLETQSSTRTMTPE